MLTEKTYPSFDKFPTIGRAGVVYVDTSTGYRYIFNQGYKIQNPTVKTINSNFGTLNAPLETVASTTVTLNKAQTKDADGTEKLVIVPSTGNFFLSSIKSLINLFFDSNRRIVDEGETMTIKGERERFFVQNLYNFGTIDIQTTGNTEYGYGILRVDGLLVNDGLILNDGLITT